MPRLRFRDRARCSNGARGSGSGSVRSVLKQAPARSTLLSRPVATKGGSDVCPQIGGLRRLLSRGGCVGLSCSCPLLTAEHD